MHGACLVSVMPSWTPHASVSPHPTLFYIFYKCAKLVASARNGGLQWLARPWAKLEALLLLVSCVTHYTGAPGKFCLPTSHREPGKGAASLLLSPNISGSPVPPPLPRIKTRAFQAVRGHPPGLVRSS